ncbi:16S rRNA (guanine(527)-N(7))-methyltransferase RsmG [Phycisphaera mikurensis]|uniref:Ribosomal RNA small subunit methyltransferase G n=1 Tax=Phycisphaera mikurensis (strain NBRC 102666 / KCTC 22515 / FYK2301M01) TaxID=1142394 RepID=I0IAH6_PHYMF|nr:16S rRNA (guanine(527)-N(7))-methyltransferase RsmG [Phycisphaera mikurensis]MBB6441739.1 16S rRNA (guanine527-N7)-methyltransferase [Phycisphaera mikurensis]BAM02264.1 ribosomal RNA small subunit methyltransferase G [Phycisphaera mikurensis NBRC 102666]
MPIPEAARAALTRLELGVPDAALETLDAYLHRLLEVNQRMNLTAVREHDAAWLRLLVDALTALPGLPGAGADAGELPTGVIDVGSGGGLPGIPLAITRPDLSFTLLEATGKKARFLEETAAALGLANVAVLNARAETAGRDPALRERYGLAVSRAVGPMPVILELTLPLVAVGGRSLCMKGPRAEQELRDSGEALHRLGAGEVAVFDAYPEGFGNDLVVVSVVKASATPKKYPRAPGMPKAEPL